MLEQHTAGISEQCDLGYLRYPIREYRFTVIGWDIVIEVLADRFHEFSILPSESHCSAVGLPAEYKTEIVQRWRERREDTM